VVKLAMQRMNAQPQNNSNIATAFQPRAVPLPCCPILAFQRVVAQNTIRFLCRNLSRIMRCRSIISSTKLGVRRVRVCRRSGPAVRMILVAADIIECDDANNG
jgi:hypothetical protein